MPFHMAAYTELLGTTANTDIDALTDDIITITNAHFQPQRDYDLVFAHVQSATLNRVRLVSPSMRQITVPFIRPITLATLPATDPNVADYRSNPFRIRALEEFAMEATSDIAMGTERFTGLVGLSSGLTPMPRGDVYTFRGTSTTAAVANTWTTLTTTFADILPAGSYVVVGGDYVATNAIAFRLNFENQIERPGGLGFATLGLRSHWMFYKGGLGIWGMFTSTRNPIVQVLNNAADAVHTIHLDIVRVR